MGGLLEEKEIELPRLAREVSLWSRLRFIYYLSRTGETGDGDYLCQKVYVGRRTSTPNQRRVPLLG